MTIRSRITLFVILSFLSILFIGGYSLYQSKNNTKYVDQVTTNVIPSVLASSDLISQIKQIQLLAMTVATETDQAILDQDTAKLQTERTTLDKALELQLSNARTDAQRGLVIQAQDSVENYFSSINDVTNLKKAGKDEIAQALFFGNVAQYQTELSQIVDTLRVEKNREKDSSIAELNHQMDKTFQTILWVTVLAMGVLAVFGYILYRRMVVPIGKMQKRMSDIATSQDFSQSLPVERMDEIGHSIVAFNGMIEKIQEASAQVKQKTADMQTMLQNIPQGLLMILQDNTVHPEYSVYLENILGTKDIAGKNFIDLVFSHADLSDDAIAQLEAVVGACVGEDQMNFDFNAHLMIHEIKKHMSDGSIKVLDISWSPITDENDTIIRLMLCIKDVTELRELAVQAEKQKLELEIIGEVLGVSPQKFNAFIDDAIRFINENGQVIRQNTEMTQFAIAKLFRNMHTIKGNARTYGLQHLASTVHHAEQYYDDLRHQKPNVVWHQTTLLAQLDEVAKKIKYYREVNNVTLGRLSTGDNANDQFMIIDRKHIQNCLRVLESVNTANIQELLWAYNTARKNLLSLGTESVPVILGNVLESLPSLAQELGKEVPMVNIEDNGYVINNRYSSVLKNVSMHLLRNSMDHGLESIDERVSVGKPAKGMITVRTQKVDDKFQIVFSDDGRGIALSRIKNIALDRGMIDSDAQLSDAQIAAIITKPGFSTKQEVTEISGRGVGMDAVNDFVSRESGKMSFVLTDGKEGDAFRHFMTVLEFPANIAVKVDDNGLINPAQTPKTSSANTASLTA